MDEKSNFIYIKGARVHNLKNIDVKIPHNSLVVITGLSGSGKSTLAFDTIFAEGQRRYVESLSAYARQFLGRVHKPDVDSIDGIAPAIAIEQKVISRNPRSTVGTTTEIYDYLRLLYARIGKTISPISGREVKAHSVDDVVDYIRSLKTGDKVYILAPLAIDSKQGYIERLTLLSKDGMDRFWYEDKMVYVNDILPDISKYKQDKLKIFISRSVVSENVDDKDTLSRYNDSVSQAFAFGNGECFVAVQKNDGTVYEHFSNRFELDGMEFTEPNEYLFSFNNPIGACPRCEGYGKIIGIDEDLVVPDKTKSVYDNAIAAWRGESTGWWKEQLIKNASKFDFPIHRSYLDLTPQQKALLWKGNEYFQGLNAFFDYLNAEKYKIQYRYMLSRYTGKTTCPECGGARLRPEALYVKVGGRAISELVNMPIDELFEFFNTVEFDEHDSFVGSRILLEIRSRLSYLLDVGLGYLMLDRLSSTLSGGESQRINLATSLGSSLVGSLYILDEPSIGLHPRDTHRLIKVLKQLRDLGNTVIVVEHEEEVMRAADQIIDIGPYAGIHGGEIVFQGSFDKLPSAKNSLTAKYLTGQEQIPVPKQRRKWNQYIKVLSPRANNLKGEDVKIPLGIMTCVTGVSGSGKSTLVKSILYPAMKRALDIVGEKPGDFGGLEGDVNMVYGVEMIDQNPIGKSSRSNPVTYVKAYDDIRKLFSDMPYAKTCGYTPSHFSFNIAGGRCEECQGEGVIKVEMQFMADVELTCEVCGGKRFKDDLLLVKYRDKNISDILDMNVDQALEFFGQDKRSECRKICEKLQVLSDVGLGYIRLGQSSSTLSGGESQRVKLAYFLLKDNADKRRLFIFDEPTTGLHFHDIRKLLKSFNALIENGHTVLVVEHNMDVIRACDWVIDLGPEGGGKGGHVVFEGTPDELANKKDSYTGQFLSQNMKYKEFKK